MSAADVPAGELVSGELMLTGRITTASNATFLGAISDTPVVYKPVAGEAPLWDFPAGTLARREVAAHLVSEALGWDIVPRTWLRDGPFGEGMVQLWQEQDPEQDAVDLFPADEVPTSGWLTILEGEDEGGNRLVLAHEDSAALRRMAVFDVIVNNAGVMLLGTIVGADPEDWRRMLHTNVLGLMYMTHAAIEGMVEQGSGDVVNISSVAGRQARKGAGWASDFAGEIAHLAKHQIAQLKK